MENGQEGQEKSLNTVEDKRKRTYHIPGMRMWRWVNKQMKAHQIFFVVFWCFDRTVRVRMSQCLCILIKWLYFHEFVGIFRIHPVRTSLLWILLCCYRPFHSGACWKYCQQIRAENTTPTKYWSTFFRLSNTQWTDMRVCALRACLFDSYAFWKEISTLGL